MSYLTREVSRSFSVLHLNLIRCHIGLFQTSAKLNTLSPYKNLCPQHVGLGLLFSNKDFVKFYCSENKNPDPIRRALNILKKDMKHVIRLLDDSSVTEENFRPEPEFPSHCDVLVVGGGIIGSSIAYWLKQRALSGLSVVVLEKDSSVIQSSLSNHKYSTASTTLSAGGLRQQFSLPENIQMSMFGAEFIRNIESHLFIDGFETPDVQFTPLGYLFLATEKGAPICEENSKIQKHLGAKNELLTPKQIKQKWPWINTDGVALGCHGLENEGWFDPWSLLMAFKRKAMFLGAEYVTGELESFKMEAQPSIIMDTVPMGEYVGVRGANIKLANGETKHIQFAQLVIAAGAQSGAVGQLAGIGSGAGFLSLPIPVEPRKRYIYCFHCPNGPGLKAPFVIDPSGMYFRREGFGDNYICGLSPEPSDEPSCDNLDVDHTFFHEQIWPRLAHRVPAFESLKVKSSWAGFYDYNTFDENAIVGPHPSYMNVFLATGFSGHGLQQAPAIGRAIMELMIDGRFVTIDLTRMQFERIFHDEFLLERNIV